MAVAPSDDDGFREIQLNGKQLVFLFMAVTVVLVVTFLTGVLVGRGVRAERAEAAQADVLTDQPPTPERAPEPLADADDPTKATPPPAEPEDAASEQPPVAVARNPEPVPPAPPADTTKPAAATTARNDAKPAAAAAPASKPPQAPVPPADVSPRNAASANANAAVASAPPSGPRNGYAVQVAAVNVRGEADAIVRRLSAKGYSAYVEVPKNNASVFRVRVGTFRTRREAQTMADRLKKEEKFKPWVTR